MAADQAHGRDQLAIEDSRPDPLDLDPARDADPRTGLSVMQTAGVIEITSTNNFLLVFDNEHHWQASAWYDLRQPEGPNLGGASSSPKGQVVQSPVGLLLVNRALIDPDARGWLTLNNVEPGSATGRSEGVNSDTANIETKWSWQLETGTLQVSTLHTIERNGLWTVDVTVAPADAASQVAFEAFEYGYTNVNPTLSWSRVDSTTELSFVQRSGPQPYARIDILRSPQFAEPHGWAPSDSDDPKTNVYWQVGQLITVSQATPLRFSYQNRIGSASANR